MSAESPERDDITEWAVRHSQGIRTCRDERDAQESLVEMTARFEKNFRNKVRPVILTRTVSPWVEHITPSGGESDG